MEPQTWVNAASILNTQQAAMHQEIGHFLHTVFHGLLLLAEKACSFTSTKTRYQNPKLWYASDNVEIL